MSSALNPIFSGSSSAPDNRGPTRPEGLNSGGTAAEAHGEHDSPENRVIPLPSCSIPSIGKLQAADHPSSRMRVNDM